MEKTIIVVQARSLGKSVAIKQLLEEIAPVVIIDDINGTNVHRSDLTDTMTGLMGERRPDITYEIKNYRESDPEQHEIVKKENPYKNGMLRKKGKGGYRKY